jgi:polyphosphate kinase
MKFFNRDLSWLGFNSRVLSEAEVKTVPLYDRLKFLSIFSSNLDEFFRVRYPEVVALATLDNKTLKKEGLADAKAVLIETQAIINKQLNLFGKILHEQLLPSLEKENVCFYYDKPINPIHFPEMKEIFLSRVLSFIQPVFLGTRKVNSFIPENGKIYFVVTLYNIEKESLSHAMVNIPSSKLNRFFVLNKIDNIHQVVFIDDIIRENLSVVFPGQEIRQVFAVKFNRDAGLLESEEYSTNLLDKIEKNHSSRELGAPTRFLYEAGMPVNLQLFMSETFGFRKSDMFEGGRYHNLSDLFSFPCFDDNLKYKDDKPILYPKEAATGDIFKAVSNKDILLHIPYHSYTPVLSFFNQAAVDEDVTDISITLYRVAAESFIVNALISAAKNGKNVTAYIELKARFDEANNIKWSRIMKKAGVKLVYSNPTIKVHSKIALITKKQDGVKSNFAVVSTGNFNENTAKFYTDHVLFTVDKQICKELKQLFVFMSLRESSKAKEKLVFDDLLVAQFNINDKFEGLIDEQIKKVKVGEKGLIRIKVNNLEDTDFIKLLYNASQKGVEVRLIVRSICSLIPGKKGLSENIIVKRLVDKYLEHPRLFIFGKDDDAVAIMGSSDLMSRNLKRRIEVCVPVKDKNCAQEIIDYFDIQWSDDVKIVQLNEHLENTYLKDSTGTNRSQETIYNYLEQKMHD